MENTTELPWITDLHIETLSPRQRCRLISQLRGHPSGTILLTGDLSLARRVVGCLEELSDLLPEKTICFTLGNHDFFGGSIKEVDARINRLCSSRKNLMHLDGRQIVPIDGNSCLIGHRGWGDGKAGLGNRSKARNADFWMIKDLRGSREEAFRKIAALGEESAKAFRSILPQALSRYRRVIVGTHVPPFRQALRFGDHKCHPARYPHFVNIASGQVIGGIAKEFPDRKINVLCGHTHTARKTPILPNLSVEVGAPCMLNRFVLAA